MNRVAVSERTIRWALDRSRLADREVNDRFPGIHNWLDGTRPPTLKQLEGFAKATRTPLGLLFLDEPPEDSLPIPLFRTSADDGVAGPSPDLLESVQVMQRRQEWMREYLASHGQRPLPFVRASGAGEAASTVADRMREALGFAPDWAASMPNWPEAMRALCDGMERSGVLTVVNGVVGNNTHRKLDVAEFRGFVLSDDLAPLVFVNGSDAKAAQMFTLAHEFAHVHLGASAAFDLREMQPAPDSAELACNRAAAEFLVPEDEMRRVWQSLQRSSEPFEGAARQFKVSRLVAARRALDLGLIGRDLFLDLYQAWRQEAEGRSTRKAAGGDFYATQSFRLSRRFARAVLCAVQEGELSYLEAYRLTGLYGATFDAYAASVGFGGPL